jgi:hypothetical protein
LKALPHGFNELRAALAGDGGKKDQLLDGNGQAGGGGQQGGALLAAGQLVGFGEHRNGGDALHTQPVPQLQVVHRGRSPRIHDLHHAAQRWPPGEIVFHHRTPLRAHRLGHSGKAAAGQIDKVAGLIDPEEIERLGLSSSTAKSNQLPADL